MKTDFDLDRIGKRMPYSVPEHFFEKLEDDLWKEVQTMPVETDTAQSSSSAWRRKYPVPAWLTWGASVAAIVACLMGGTWWFMQSQSVEGEVEQAFAELTPEDQNYLLSVYQEELFLNE